MRTAVRGLCAVVVATAALGVRAAPVETASQEEASARFDRGREFYEEGDFVAALMEFRRAYELSPNFKLLYNVAQVCYQLQDHPCALQSFIKYLGDGGGAIPDARVTEVQQEIERLKSRVARLVISATVPDAVIAVDDVVVGKVPLGSAVVVSAGRHRVAASLKGYLPASEVVGVASMELRRLTLELTPLVDDGPRPPRAAADERAQPLVETRAPEQPVVRYNRPSPWFWLFPLALAGGGITMGTWANREAQSLATWRLRPETPQSELDARSANVKKYALISDVLDGAAVVSAVVLAVLSIFPQTQVVAQAPRSALRFDLGAGGVCVSGQF